MDIQNHRIGVDYQFGLKGGDQRERDRTNWTHVEDMKNPIEVQLPRPNRFLIILCMHKSGYQILFTLLSDLLLDLLHCPAITSAVGELSKLRIGGLTHVVSCSIASRTGWLRSYNSFPPIPRCRALHTFAQVSPSST